MVKFEVGKIYASAWDGEYAVLILKRTPKTVTVKFLQWWINAFIGIKNVRIDTESFRCDEAESFYVSKGKKFGCGFFADDCICSVKDLFKVYPELSQSPAYENLKALA